MLTLTTRLKSLSSYTFILLLLQYPGLYSQGIKVVKSGNTFCKLWLLADRLTSFQPQPLVASCDMLGKTGNRYILVRPMTVWKFSLILCEITALHNRTLSIE